MITLCVNYLIDTLKYRAYILSLSSDSTTFTASPCSRSVLPPQDVNCDRISVSSLTSAEADCSSLLDNDSCLDVDGFTSPQHGAMSRLRRSPVIGHGNLGSPGTPSRVFRHNSFSGGLTACFLAELRHTRGCQGGGGGC